MSTPAAPTVNVTTILQNIFDDVGEPLLITILGTVVPWLPALFKIPIIGPMLSSGLKAVVDKLIALGVIEIKIGIISFLSSEAQTKWADELTILKQVQAAGKVLTPDEQAAYDAALQAIVKNHPGVVNA